MHANMQQYINHKIKRITNIMHFSILDSDKEICLLDTNNPYHAVNPPIVQSTLFSFDSMAQYRDYRNGQVKNRYAYSRGDNPTLTILEEKLAKLERGEKCRVFSSGMAAITSAIIGHIRPQEHILFINTIYGPTIEYANFLTEFNIQFTYLRDTSIQSIANAIQTNTKIIFVETPGSFDLQVIDLLALAKLAKQKNIITMIDNTNLTPLLQKPLTLGIDISIHTCSKYIGGHADVIAGAVITSQELMSPIEKYGFKLHGAVLPAHDAALLIRGLRTLPSRLESQATTIMEIINFLQSAPKINKIYHPLVYNPIDSAIFESQATGYTSLISIELNVTSYAELDKFIDSLQTFHIGVSWGGYENTIIAPNYNGTFEELMQTANKPTLIRLGIGLLSANSIISDLQQAILK